MARTKTTQTRGGKDVPEIRPKRRTGKAVRLDLTERDHERLDRVARAKGLNMAALSRMAILDLLRKFEEELGL
jgi:hypothetical protein